MRGFGLHSVADFLAHRSEVHGFLDELTVLRHVTSVDRFQEWPRITVRLHLVQEFTKNDDANISIITLIIRF